MFYSCIALYSLTNERPCLSFSIGMKKIIEIIASGEIGTIVNVQGDFGWCNNDCPYPDDRIW